MSRNTTNTAALVAGVVAGWAAERMMMRRIDVATTSSSPVPLPVDAVDRTMTTADGGAMHWIEAGSGRPLVLLHGITLEAEAWSRQFVLADRAHVLAVDLRGHGSSTSGADGASISTNAADLAALLEHEDLREVVLAGHSMGGMVVAHFLATAPPETLERVRGVAFVDSAVRSPVRAPLRHQRLDGILQRPAIAAVIGTVPDSDAGLIAVMSTFGRRPSRLDLQTVANSFDRLDPETYWQSMPSILEHDVREALAARSDLDRLDIAVIVGALDRLTPLRCAHELVTTFAGARLHVLDGVGHQAMMEAPDAVNAVLGELLDESA